MNILNDIYKHSVAENEKNIKFWEEYLHSLNTLNFSVYSDKLTVPILVPIGNRIFFRGNLKHTNEVTVALGADYFAKCSIKQAEILKQHRIKGVKSKLEEHYKEREYLENQIFGTKSINENLGKDIIEHYTEEEDKIWREIHRKKLRDYNKNKSNEEKQMRNDVGDEELWNRLEELELQEELENELTHNEIIAETEEIRSDTFCVKEGEVSSSNNQPQKIQAAEVARITHNIPEHTSKLDLLEQVIERQKMLETKLGEIKNRERTQTKTESELLTRLDEMEQLDELEDEMDRLDDMLNEDDENEEGDTYSNSDVTQNKHKQTISFADEDDNSTLQVTFKHSNVEPCAQPYDSNKGIVKPSDIYDAYFNLFSINKFKSILKKTKYATDQIDFENEDKGVSILEESSKPRVNETIIVKDISEKSGGRDSKKEEVRPTSLFKKRRQQKGL